MPRDPRGIERASWALTVTSYLQILLYGCSTMHRRPLKQPAHRRTNPFLETRLKGHCCSFRGFLQTTTKVLRIISRTDKEAETSNSLPPASGPTLYRDYPLPYPSCVCLNQREECGFIELVSFCVHQCHHFNGMIMNKGIFQLQIRKKCIHCWSVEVCPRRSRRHPQMWSFKTRLKEIGQDERYL